MMLPASVLSLALACIFFVMLRVRAPRWAYVVLVVLLIVTYRIGLLVTGDMEVSLFGTAVSLYAFTFTQSVPDSALKRGLRKLLPSPLTEPRGAPILEKFN
jgi:hypothetical protein